MSHEPSSRSPWTGETRFVAVYDDETDFDEFGSEDPEEFDDDDAEFEDEEWDEESDDDESGDYEEF